MKKHLFILMSLGLLFSCKKEFKTNSKDVSNILAKQTSKTIFSKTLAIAVEKEPLLRAFIKNEALKKFDMDNDVLFQMVKNEKVSDDETFYQILTKYATSISELDQAIESMPTLTIMVPEVPNFSPEKWNTNSEIPQIAVSPEKKRASAVYLFDSKGTQTKVPFGQVPGFAVLVVKENERITTEGSISSDNLSFFNSGNLRYSFKDSAFNPKKIAQNSNILISNKLMSVGPDKISRSIPVNPIVRPNRDGSPGTLDPSYVIEPKVVTAFNNNVEWHRDYVYYGINPAGGVNRGKFDNTIIETIASIKMNTLDLTKFSDQDNDPSPTGNGYSYSGTSTVYPQEWTDGYFDLRISVLINSKGGGGTDVNFAVSAKGSDLYDIKYKQVGTSAFFQYDGITPRDFFINQPIVSWDLEEYGKTWKFIVTEFDNSEVTVITKSNTSTYATNFEYTVSIGDKEKVGSKFGTSSTFTQTNTSQVTTTRTSDFLGEGILEFSDPIILRRETVPGRGGSDNYITSSVNCGNILLSIEPKKRM